MLKHKRADIGVGVLFARVTELEAAIERMDRASQPKAEASARRLFSKLRPRG